MPRKGRKRVANENLRVTVWSDGFVGQQKRSSAPSEDTFYSPRNANRLTLCEQKKKKKEEEKGGVISGQRCGRGGSGAATAVRSSSSTIVEC